MSLSMKVATALLTSVDSALLGRKVELSLDWTPESLPWAAPPSAAHDQPDDDDQDGSPDGDPGASGAGTDLVGLFAHGASLG